MDIERISWKELRDIVNTYSQRMNRALYGPKSIFTQEEQAAMRRGYTRNERKAISGCVYGDYPQAISAEHARKMDRVNAIIRI